MVKVSAPGKLMLFGEHSVVYDRPCIVLSVNHRMSVEMRERGNRKIILNAKDVGVEDYEINTSQLGEEHPKGARFVLQAVNNFFDKFKFSCGLEIKTRSEFSSLFGFGSSSAVTVCTIKALSEIFNKQMDKKDIFDLAYKTVLDIQGVGSGFDVAAAVYGGVLYFVTGGKVIEELEIGNLPLVVGYTGVKADTATLVKGLRERLEKKPEQINSIFDKITEIVEKAKANLNNTEELGKLMNENQKLLEKLGVSSPELNKLIDACLFSGAKGAKLSGAGGGDCMIALGDVGEAIEKAGGKVIPVEINVEGVRKD